MDIVKEKGTVVLSNFGEVLLFHYDAWTTWEGFKLLFGKYDGIIGVSYMVEASSNARAVNSTECTSRIKGRLYESMCNVFQRKAYGKNFAELVENARLRQNKSTEFELWKVSLIGQGLL